MILKKITSLMKIMSGLKIVLGRKMNRLKIENSAKKTVKDAKSEKRKNKMPKHIKKRKEKQASKKN